MLKDLLNKHKQHLSSSQADAIKEKIRRMAEMDKLVYPEGSDDIEAQSAFILFERAFCEQPVALFGQDVPSIAHTIVRIFRARHSEGGAFEPAKEIFRARISEKALTECILSPNMGDAGAPMTVTQLNGLDLPLRSRDVVQAHRGSSSRCKSRAETQGGRLQDVRDLLASNGGRPNADLKEAVSSLKYAVRDTLGVSFDLERYMEDMGEIRNEILTEASHAALHAEKVARNLKENSLALPAPEPTDWNALCKDHPLVDLMVDPVGDDYREGLRALIIAELREMSERHPKILDRIKEEDELPTVHFGTGRDVGEMLTGYATQGEERKKLDGMAQIWNHVFNPHIAADRPNYHATQAGMRLSRRQGYTGHIHSSLPPVTDSYFSVSIQPAHYQADAFFGKIGSRHAPLIELEIVAQDLMTALRGHPEGKPVPCSFRLIGGRHFPQIDRPIAEISASIAAVDESIKASSEAQAAEQALEKVISLAHAKRSGKKWLSEIEAAFGEFCMSLETLAEVSTREAEAGRQDVNRHIAQSAKAMLEEISTTLPEDVLHILQLPK